MNLVPRVSVGQAMAECFLLWMCNSRGGMDLASATAVPPDDYSERGLLWSQHIPLWIRTGNQSRNRISPSLLSLPNPAAPPQRHPQHFLLQLVWPCYIGDREALWKSRPSSVHHTFSKRPSKQASLKARGYHQNSTAQICKLIAHKANGQQAA